MFTESGPFSTPPSNPQTRPSASSPISRLTSFLTGQLSGVTLRAELEELQKADLGRKYARKDRRPLDPPPVVRLRLFEVTDPGTPSHAEREVNDNLDVKSFGFLCHVDLFPVPRQTAEGATSSPIPTRSNDHAASPAPPSVGHSLARSAPYTPINNYNAASMPPSAFSVYSQAPSIQPHVGSLHALSIPALIEVPTPLAMLPLQVDRGLSSGANDSLAHPQRNTGSPRRLTPGTRSDLVAYFGNHSIMESSNRTSALVGNTFVAPSCLEYQGNKTAMFIFSDIAVRIEGTFILRYRVFNIFPTGVAGYEIPVIAECYGGPFIIYPSQGFPGLQASTDLTKHISYFGIRLNSRETERKRRKNNNGEPSGGRQRAPITPREPPASANSPTASGSSTSEANYGRRSML